MLKFASVSSALLLLSVVGVANVPPGTHGRTLAVVMTNDPDVNQIEVYDATTRTLLQTLSTDGKGGVGGNARGVKQYRGELVAAVNNGSSSVALFRRDHDLLKFEQLVGTSSQPVSVDFSNDHMYVAGATTVDSFAMRNGRVEGLDGTTGLVLADGGVPPDGSTAQVGVVDDRQLLVTLKADPDPGTVDVVALTSGRITGAVPAAVSAPDGTLAPFGFSVYPDGTALITLAHSNQDALFRNGAFTAIVDAGQAADCWTTRVGKYVFTTNTASRTLSRLVGTGNNVFVDDQIATTIPTGGPTDLDAVGGVLAVVDHGAGESHLSFFRYNAFGELSASDPAINLGVPDANGVALIPPTDLDTN
jgi:hypothetical protein